MVVGLRCHGPFLAAVDRWRERVDNKLSRPAAIMRLAEIGLAGAKPAGRTNPKIAAKASEMAAQTLDRLTDQSASTEERSRRKRRLLKGPREFRGMRRDRD
jgi:hypothetical protein